MSRLEQWNRFQSENYSPDEENTMLTFAKCIELMQSKKCRNGQVKLAGNTYLIPLTSDIFTVRYHNTNIIYIWSDGTYELFNNGYITKTTKERINEYSPAQIFQHKFKWYHRRNGFAVAIEFYDGMRLDQFGQVIDSWSNRAIAVGLATDTPWEVIEDREKELGILQ